MADRPILVLGLGRADRSAGDGPGAAAPEREPHRRRRPGLDEVMLTGIAGGVFHRRLTGRGDVLGVKFTVGAFRLLSTTRVQQLSAYGAPGAHLLPGGERLQQAIQGIGRPDQVRLIEDY